jgi:hypothetical protein
LRTACVLVMKFLAWPEVPENQLAKQLSYAQKLTEKHTLLLNFRHLFRNCKNDKEDVLL